MVTSKNSKTGTSCREPTSLRRSATAGMVCQKQHGHKQKQGLHAGSQQQQECRQQQGCQQQQGAPETACTQVKTGTSCRQLTALRTSPTAGMPTATWCTRHSMVTSKNRNFMQGVNSIEKVTNSRDANSNMVRQKQHGHNLKQGLHVGSQRH